MKIPLALLILLLLPLATAVQTRLNHPAMEVAAQTRPNSMLTAPPIKMGLWKTASTSTLGGAPPQAGRGASPGQQQTVNTLSCITPEKWKETFTRGQRGQRCQLSNQQQSTSGMSADIACSSSRGPATTGHIDMTFDSNTRMHGTIHMAVSMESQPQPLNIDTTMQSTYQGADCQGISPDSPKVIQ